jgi:hypothetical protein
MLNYKNSKSASFQESFVISMTKEKKYGFYIELGSGDPYKESNTFLLESEFGWKGLALEIEKSVAEGYNLSDRTNKCINADALKFDYLTHLKENNFPEVIDFLQIDIDGHDMGNCLLALVALPMMKYRFSVIIIEHDVCENYKRASMRDAQREILSSLGYKLIGQTNSEDWWVDPKYIDNDAYRNDIFIGNPQVSGFVDTRMVD